MFSKKIYTVYDVQRYCVLHLIEPLFFVLQSLDQVPAELDVDPGH